MNTSLFRPVLFGALFGALAFFIPFFLFRLFFIFLIFGLFFGLFFRGGRRFNGWRGGPAGRWAFADKIRNMSDEEYAAFREKARHFGGCYRNEQAFEGDFTGNTKA